GGASPGRPRGPLSGAAASRHAIENDAKEVRPHLVGREVILLVVAVVAQCGQTVAVVPIRKMLAAGVAGAGVVGQEGRIPFAGHTKRRHAPDPAETLPGGARDAPERPRFL